MHQHKLNSQRQFLPVTQGIAEHSNRSTSSRQMKEPSSYSTEALQHRPPRPPQQHSDGGSDELSDEEDTDEDSSASESTDKDSQLVYTSGNDYNIYIYIYIYIYI